MQLNRDGKKVYTGGKSGAVKVWDLNSLSIRKKYQVRKMDEPGRGRCSFEYSLKSQNFAEIPFSLVQFRFKLNCEYFTLFWLTIFIILIKDSLFRNAATLTSYYFET